MKSTDCTLAIIPAEYRPTVTAGGDDALLPGGARPARRDLRCREIFTDLIGFTFLMAILFGGLFLAGGLS